MHKRLLTIDDLVNFFEEKDIAHFSATESGYQICVQVPSYFKKKKEVDEQSNSKFLIKDALVFHTGKNLNHSFVTEAAAEKAINDLAYVPVLANFCEIDGVRDFTTHDFEFDDDGNIIYHEKQIGCITSDPIYMEDDEKVEGRKNVFAKVAIPRNYTDAADIIERKGGTDVSVEMIINDMSYSKENGVVFNDISITGLTCLGVDPTTGKKINPGMENARISLEDFSVTNNSVVMNKELIEEITQAVMNKLDDHIAEYSAKNNHGKEDEIVEKFDEEIKDTQLEATEEVTDQVTEEEAPEVVEEETVEEIQESEESESNENSEEEEESETEEFSAKFVKNFELSHDDIRCALYNLLLPFEESDNDWYCITQVYDNHFVYEGWFDASHVFDQKYSKNGDEISFDGERVHMNKILVTDSEYAQLNEMRSNYASISEKLAKYEAEPEKMEILNSKEYMSIADQKDFEELKKQENHFDLSVDELRGKADAMLLQFAKSGKIGSSATYEVEDEKKNNNSAKKDFFAFARIEPNYSFLDGLLKK